jgi:hypothetical protein
LAHELLWIETEGGSKLAASFHLPEAPRPAPVVVMCHGFTGHRQEAHFLFVHAARAFKDAGFAALRIDCRGSGESDGVFSDMTLETEIADVRAGIDYVAGRPEIDTSRIGILGLSMGGCVCATVAGRDQRVKTLVLWAATANMGRSTKRFEERDAGPPQLPDGTWDLGGIALGQGAVDSFQTVLPLEEIKTFGGPALIVHGTEDQAVPMSDALEYRQVLGERGELHIINGSDHVFSSVPWQTEAILASSEFLKANL